MGFNSGFKGLNNERKLTLATRCVMIQAECPSVAVTIHQKADRGLKFYRYFYDGNEIGQAKYHRNQSNGSGLHRDVYVPWNGLLIFRLHAK